MGENNGRMKHIFSDNKLQLHYDEFGYAVVNLLDANMISSLLEAYKRLDPKASQPFHSTLHNPDINYRREVFKSIVGVAGESINSIFLKPLIITSSFVVKEPNEQSHVVIHQDWNLTEERFFPGFNVWFPLINTNEQNGTLYVLPGSHKTRQFYRGTNTNNPLEFCNLSLEQLTKIDLKAGEAIIYDVRLLHGSPPNKSSVTRIACAMGVVPEEAALIHIKYDTPGNMLIEYEITPEFYFQYSPNEEFFSTLKINRKIPVSPPWQPSEMQKFTHSVRKNSIFNRIFTSIKGK